MHKRLLQLLRDNAKREISALKVIDEGDSTTIYLYDVIDPYFGVDAQAFNKQLLALQGKSVTLRINSPGGDVFDGRAIATAIAQHGDVTVMIDGLAASAATYVAIAAKEVRMAEGAFFMVHNAWTLAYGNKSDLINTADLLDKIDQSIINDYAKKTSQSLEAITAWMDAETWFSAEEALANGFVDQVFTGNDVNNSWNLEAFSNTPQALKEPPKAKPPVFDEQQHLQMNTNRLRLLEIA